LIVMVGNMHEERNFQILQLGNISIKKIILKISTRAIIVYICIFIAFDYASVFFNENANAYRERKIHKSETVDFSGSTWFKQGPNFIHIAENFKGKDLKEISIFEVSDNKLKSLKKSKQGIIEDDQLKLSEINGVNLYEKTNTEFVTPVKNNILNTIILLEENQINFLKRTPQNLNLQQLISQLYFLYKNEIVSRGYVSELMIRIFAPVNLFSILILILPKILSSNKRNSVSKKIFLAVFIGILVNFTVKLSSTFASNSEYIIFFNIAPTILLFLFALFRLNTKV